MIDRNAPLFVWDVFQKVLAITLSLVFLGCLTAYLYYGELVARDIIGSLISGVIFAYMVHLWVLMAGENSESI